LFKLVAVGDEVQLAAERTEQIAKLLDEPAAAVLSVSTGGAQ